MTQWWSHIHLRLVVRLYVAEALPAGASWQMRDGVPPMSCRHTKTHSSSCVLLTCYLLLLLPTQPFSRTPFKSGLLHHVSQTNTAHSGFLCLCSSSLRITYWVSCPKCFPSWQFIWCNWKLLESRRAFLQTWDPHVSFPEYLPCRVIGGEFVWFRFKNPD